jgi:hypothetical protein
MIAIDKTQEVYINSLRTLHAALNDYLLLIGEPCPLLGRISFLLVETIGCLPPGDSTQANNLYTLAATILEAAIMGTISRLEGLQPESAVCLHSVLDCMKVVEQSDMSIRCTALFKVLGIAMDGLRNVTKVEYPQLADGSGKKLTGR